MNKDWIRGLGGVPRTGSTELLDDELVVCDAICSVPTVLGMILGGEFGESFNLPYDLTNEGAMEELVEGMEKRNILERKGELGKLGPLVVLTVKGGELWERERKPVWEAFFQPRFSSPGVHKRTFIVSALRQDILEAYLSFGRESGIFQTAEAKPEFTIERDGWLVPWKQVDLITLKIELLDAPAAIIWSDLQESKRVWWRTI